MAMVMRIGIGTGKTYRTYRTYTSLMFHKLQSITINTRVSGQDEAMHMHEPIKKSTKDTKEQRAGKRKQKLDTAGHTRNEEAAKRLSSLSTIRILLSTHLLELSVSSLLHFYTFT